MLSDRVGEPALTRPPQTHSREIARIYRMTFEDGEWILWRGAADFSPLDFEQRFTGALSSDWSTIAGRWEIRHDGTTSERDFDLTYTRLT